MTKEDVENEVKVNDDQIQKDEEDFDAYFDQIMKEDYSEIDDINNPSKDEDDDVGDDKLETSNDSPKLKEDDDSIDEDGTKEDDSNEFITQLKNTNKSLNGRISASDKRVNELAEKNQALQEQLTELQDKLKNFPETKSDESDDEDDLDDDYFANEYPDMDVPLKKAIKKHTRQRTKNLEYKISQLENTVAGLSTNVQTQQEKDTNNEFNNLVQSQVPDINVEDIVKSGELMEWIDSQTPLMKRAYSDTAQYGTMSEVVEMLQNFQKDANKKRKNTAKQNEHNRKLNALVPPRTESAVPQDREPKNSGDGSRYDFDAGWNLPSKGV